MIMLTLIQLYFTINIILCNEKEGIIMSIKIAIANQKGGIGKTTTALNLADGLVHIGYKVLFIDLDPQRNSTTTYGAKIENTNTIVDVLKKDCKASEAIQHMPMGDIIAGDQLLVQEEMYFNSLKARENLLKRQIKEIEDEYDYIVMDTPPNLGVYMINALTAADGCIIPIEAESYAIDGLSLLIDTVNEVVDALNEDLKIYGVLLNKYDSRNKLDRMIKEALPEVAKEKKFYAFQTVIRISQAIKNVQSLGNIEGGEDEIKNRSLFQSYPSSNAAIDYANFIKELLEVRING